MKDFNDFLALLAISEIKNKVVFDTTNTLEDVSANQRTVSGDEWHFIGESIIQANLALLRQYHQWLCQQLENKESS